VSIIVAAGAASIIVAAGAALTVGVAVDLDAQRLPQDHLPFVDTRHRDDHGDRDA
jgi:hypothetical protein